jgi:hypothetical protein
LGYCMVVVAPASCICSIRRGVAGMNRASGFRRRRFGVSSSPRKACKAFVCTRRRMYVSSSSPDPPNLLQSTSAAEGQQRAAVAFAQGDEGSPSQLRRTLALSFSVYRSLRIAATNAILQSNAMLKYRR